MPHSLDRLSDRERDLLGLLAQGHTAKTIARTRSLSVNAVNEHLRSARRKTDASSSRELARLVAGRDGARPQETRDNLIGVEAVAAPPHPTPHPQGPATGAWTPLRVWRPVMILAGLFAAGLLAWQTSTPGPTVPSGASDAGPAPATADAVRPDVIYQVIFLKDGEHLSTPTVAGRFGHEVRVEIPNLMRVVMITEAPDADGRSFTSAKMALFRDNGWGPAKELSTRANLTSTPSFEYSVEGTPYRFVVMPRLIVPAAS